MRLPWSQVDPLVSLMMVEKVPDSTYDMIGGLDKQIKEIKEVGPAWTHGTNSNLAQSVVLE